MIEVSIRKFYVTEDLTDVVPRAAMLRTPTAVELAALEDVFDEFAEECGAVEMTDEQVADYLKCEQQEIEDSNNPDAFTLFNERA